MPFLLQNKKNFVKLNHTDKSLMVFHKVYQHFSIPPFTEVSKITSKHLQPR